MVTVSHLVEKIIEQKPFLQEALSRGIVNNAALAEQLIPQIEKELKKKVKFSAVNMAVRRLIEKLDNKFQAEIKFDKNSDLVLRSDLIMIPLYRTEDARKYLKELQNIVDFKKGDFLTITEGLYEIMIVTNDKYKNKIKELIPNRLIKKTFTNLSSVTIRVAIEALEMVGLFFLITRALAWENINIFEIVSTPTEMTLLFKEDDTGRAFDTLKRMIKQQNA